MFYQKLKNLSKQTRKTLQKWICIIKFFSNNSSNNNLRLVNSRMPSQSKLVFLVNYLQAIKYYQLKIITNCKNKEKLKRKKLLFLVNYLQAIKFFQLKNITQCSSKELKSNN